jgi:diapolycopene oxygenase
MSEKTTKKAIVIGAGLGGLSAAVHLTSSGFDVEIFEKNDKVGGKLNVMEMEGFTFDLGPSILTLPHIFEDLFSHAGRDIYDYVKFTEVVPHWGNFFEDGTVIDLTPDTRLMEKELAKLPGDESRGFYKFMEYSRDLYQIMEEGYFPQGLETLGEIIHHYGIPRTLTRFDMFRTMNQGVRRFIRNDKLVDILDYFIKYVGSSPYDAPALLNLIAYAQFGYGLWYVEGGMYNLARAIEDLARELDIKIHLNTEVKSIVAQGNRVTGVKDNKGKESSADIVVSNMEVVPAYRDLLSEDTEFHKKYDKFEPACSGFVLHLGVKTIYPELRHHNFFYSKNSRKHFDTIFHSRTLSQDPTIYLVAPCKTDPDQAPEGCEVIKILPHIPYLKDENPFTQEEYSAYRDIVLDKLERMGLKDLRKNVVCELQWTPEDILQRYYSHKGAIYGVLSDKRKNYGFKTPRKSEKYNNLYFVGGSVNPGGGMPMVVFSGKKAAEVILKDFSTNSN